MELLKQLLITTKLALVDSINPCCLAIYSSLLSLLLTKSRRDMVIGGVLFIITIYLMYMLYGLVIHFFILEFYDIVRLALFFLLILLIVLEFLAYFRYKPGLVSVEMPLKLRPLVSKLMEKLTSPLMAVPLAILLSLFLLPCSSGPYFVFLSLSKKINYFFLFYYLFIFVLPMIIITLLVYFGLNPKKVKEFRDKHIRELHLISGILLLLVLISLII